MTDATPDDATRFAPAPASAGDDPFRAALAGALDPAYELGRELEGGGMSRVFVAVERSLGRTVVVKVLPPDLAAGVNRDRFRREIKVAAQLQHPHIVPLLSAGEIALADGEGTLYYTMPFIEGESLRSAVLRGARFSARDVERILHDVVEGLAYAHARGVIHRDIKPGNVLMLGSHALVTDFGVAKALSAAQGRSGTTTIGLAIGTPAYMAPEQLAADPAADHRMDLYAAGLVAYELLRGESPFAAASPQATMAAQLTRVPEPLDQCCADVPAELSAVIMRCLEKSPDDRWPSADAMLAALDGARTPAPGTAGARRVPGTAQTAAPRRGRALVGAGALAVLAGAAVLWAANREAPPTGPPATVADADAAVSVPVSPPSTSPAAAVGAPSATAPVARPAAPRPPRELTRADSLAIAAAVQQRIEETQRARVGDAPSVRELEQLRTMIHRDLSDSMRRVIAGAAAIVGPSIALGERLRSQTEFRVGAGAGSAVAARIAAGVTPPREGARRVAVMSFQDATARPELAGVAPAVEGALRRAVAERGGYELADTSATREAVRQLRAPEAVGMATQSGATIVGLVHVQRDSLVLTAHVFDTRRGYPVQSIVAKRPLGDGADPLAVLPAFAARVAAALNAVGWNRPGRHVVRPAPPAVPLPPASP